MAMPKVSWIEPLVVTEGPMGLEYDPEARRLDLRFDPESPVRQIVLPARREPVQVGVLDVANRGICECCRTRIAKAVGLVTLTWPTDIQCERCFWEYHAKYYYGDPAFLRRVEGGQRSAATRREREGRARQVAYAAETSKGR